MVPFVYVLVFLSIFLSLVRFMNPPSTKKNLPPSPPKLPVIGNLHQIGPLLHHSLHSLSENYGGPLMLIQLGCVPTLVVSSADAAREIMKTKDIVFANRPDVKVWRRLLCELKEVSAAPYGEYWRQVKSIMVLHLLSNRKIEDHRQIREEEIAIAIDKIMKSRVVNLSDLFVRFTNDVVCRVTFGQTYSEGESGRKFRKMLEEFFEVLGGLNIEDLIPWLAWVDRLRGYHAKVERVAREMDEFLDGVVEERLRDQSKAGGRENYLDVLIRIQKEDKIGVALDRLAIKALLLDAYTAGTDTTATVLEWTFTELLKHPKALKKAQDEVRMVLKGKKEISQEDIDNLKYLKAVLKETLRLHPPIPTLVPRVASHDVKVLGFDITKGTRVIVNAWAIARDPKVWDDANEFRPERFLDCNIDFKGRDFDLIPFGAGRRGCPGIAFAMATNENLLANLLHKFNWELPNGGKVDDLDMSEQPGLTIRKKVPLFVVATPVSS
ncbi:putative cytochrome P450 [Helianthus annuus]|uniref:Cytochrome P450 n=7 Tax=Helianthus annuus TaxID=4232 RepID=A0A251U0P8_HELAN|nr:cytochrome P450 71A6 [Helianthus annuus]KAF5792899.1 putative cytochrome P450 [Helianthus annuus]KAJ0544215.1 putative cytochrome P450 [Helianthus annuus]KAJ0953541.1 putative cytochrome P450 [Helianthus annuus]